MALAVRWMLNHNSILKNHEHLKQVWSSMHITLILFFNPAVIHVYVEAEQGSFLFYCFLKINKSDAAAPIKQTCTHKNKVSFLFPNFILPF